MTQPIKFFIPKLDKFKIPTPQEMKVFASKFSKDDWRKLCFSKSFMNIFVQNLDLAKKEADLLLNKV